MKARLPDSYNKGTGNMQSFVKQAQKMQEDVSKLQDELGEEEYSATVGGGAVEAVVNGHKEVKSIKIKPEVVDPEDVEMLEDLVVSAVNEALRNADEDSTSKMNAITGGMNLGGLGGLI